MSTTFLNYQNFYKVVLAIFKIKFRSRKIPYLIYYFIPKSEATKLNSIFRVPLAQLQPCLLAALVAEPCQTVIY